MLDGDARTYRPLPPAVFDRWRDAAQQDIVRADALLRLVTNLRHADGTPLDAEVLRRAANAWEETLASGVSPAHLVVCPNWQCEMPVSEETLYLKGCSRCGSRPRPMIRFPALSGSIQELLERLVCRPGERLDSALRTVEQLHLLAPQEGGVVPPWTDGRLPAAERTEIARHQTDALKHANRVTVAIAGDKNRGKSTIGNLLVGLEDAQTGDHREAFPALHVVNTQVTKEVLLSGGRFLDLPGVNSLYEQHDQEAQRRIDDADAVVLVVNAKSPLMEPEFRFVRDHVVRPSLLSSNGSGGMGSRRLVVALAKVDVLARDREERRREIEQATRYVLQGADGNEGLAILLPERSIRVVPVSAKWFGFHDLDGVRQRAEQALKELRIEAPIAPVRPVCVRREGTRLVATVSRGTDSTTGRSNLEAAREAIGPTVGATTFSQVRRAIESIPIPELPAQSAVPDARALLGGRGLGVILGVLAASMIAWLVGVPPVPVFAGALTAGIVALLLLSRRLAARLDADMRERIRAADEAWSSAVRERAVGYARSVVEEGMRVLRDVPERMESGIPELVRAIEETVSSNALAMKVVEPGQSVRKRCRDWQERLKVAGGLLDVAITRGDKQIQEMERHHRQALEAAESGVSVSLQKLAAQMSREADAIVEQEIKGVVNFFRILFGKEDSRPIQNLQRRISSEVANQGRIEDWVRSDTLNRVQKGVSEIVDRLEGALADGTTVMVRELKSICLNPDVRTGPLWKGGGMMGGGFAMVVGGLLGGAAVKGAIIGSIAGPWGTAAGFLAGAVVVIVAGIVAKFLGGHGANAMGEVRNTLKAQLRSRLGDAMLEQVQPLLVEEAAKAIEGPFREMRESAVRALAPLREDRATVTTIVAELAEIDRMVCGAAPMEVRHEFA